MPSNQWEETIWHVSQDNIVTLKWTKQKLCPSILNLRNLIHSNATVNKKMPTDDMELNTAGIPTIYSNLIHAPNEAKEDTEDTDNKKMMNTTAIKVTT